MATTDRATLATFLFTSADQPGLVAQLAGFFYDLGLNIVDAKNHTDPNAEGGARFFGVVNVRFAVEVIGVRSHKYVVCVVERMIRREINEQQCERRQHSGSEQTGAFDCATPPRTRH